MGEVPKAQARKLAKGVSHGSANVRYSAALRRMTWHYMRRYYTSRLLCSEGVTKQLMRQSFIQATTLVSRSVYSIHVRRMVQQRERICTAPCNRARVPL